MKGPNREIVVNSRNYDGTIRRSWTAEFVKTDGPMIELAGTFEFDVEHADLGLIEKGTTSYEYYWLDRWYNVFRMYEPHGHFRNFYCNINLTPSFRNNVLDYVDLEIDVLVDRDFRIRILDVEEFEESVRVFSMPDDVRSSVQLAVDELIELVEKRSFPFDRH